jgi:hypothetical protein
MFKAVYTFLKVPRALLRTERHAGQFLHALIPGQPIVEGRCAFLEVIA